MDTFALLISMQCLIVLDRISHVYIHIYVNIYAYIHMLSSRIYACKRKNVKTCKVHLEDMPVQLHPPVTVLPS